MKLPGHRPRRLLVAAVTSAALLVPLGTGEAAAATTLRVPQDFPTIQAAIAAATDGDTVLVSPGTYTELLDFQSKDITVESTAGPATTIVDANRQGTGVTMNADAGETPVLRGFTIRNAGEGGIVTAGGSALIEGNTITGNVGCFTFGIGVDFSAATIRGNVITGNGPSGCSGGLGGGGIQVGGVGTDGNAQIIGNTITGNRSAFNGGGITLFGAGAATVSANRISGNAAEPAAAGGGIWIVNASNSLITNNMIVGNTAADGDGIYWLVPIDEQGPTVVNNTITGGDGGSVVHADGFDAEAQLTNNIIYGSDASAAALFCGDFNDPNPPRIAFNDVLNTAGPEYGGICPDQTGQNGNISADPLFVNPAAGNYHVRAGSPVVDAGRNEGAPATDFDGDPRPLDGDGDGTAVVDIGADEVAGGDTTPPTITCAADPATLRPPDHTLRRVRVDITATDDAGPATVTLVSVTSSQRDRNLGPGDVPNDIQGWTTGSDDRTGRLRAERFGTARVYTLTYRAEDQAGNTATCQPTVRVPR